MKKFSSTCLITFLLILLFGTNAFPVTRTSSQSGNWSASSTWGGNPAPVAGDDVIINGGFTVTVDVTNAECISVQLGGSILNSGTGTLSFMNGSVLSVSGLVNIGPFNSNSTTGSLTMAIGGTLICEGFILGKLGTWTAGTGTIELTATNTLPNNNNIIFNNLTISGGTTSMSRNVAVNGDMVINTGATFFGGVDELTIGGNWTNDGTFTGNTGTVTFIKNGNATISGTGLNNFNHINVTMGASMNNTLEVLATNFSAPNGFLSLTNGTFKMSGLFTLTTTLMAGPDYNIDPGTGLWINNPNVTVTAQAGLMSVRGLFRLTSGTYNIGTGIDNSLEYVTGSTLLIEGGTLNIAGRLYGNNPTATTTYTQSGGIVTVVEQGSTDPDFAGFDLGVAGSTFTMSGGTIVISNATSGPADYLNAASVASVTGGTLQIGNAFTANAQTIRIQTSRPVGGLLVSNATAQPVKPTAQLLTSSLNAIGNITIQSGTIFNAGGLNITLGGDWSNNGTFTNGNNVTFNGVTGQTLTNPGTETFLNLTVNKPSSLLTLNGSLTVSNTFAFTQGTISVAGNTLTLNGTVTGAGTFSSENTGTVNYNKGSAVQNILAGSYGNLVFSNFTKTLSSTGIIGISGTFTTGLAAGHTVTGSTISFNGGSQTIPVFPFNHLITSGSGTKTGSGTITVSGNLTNNAGVVFAATILNLNGTAHVNNGTLTATTLTIGPVATITNNGTLTASSALNGAGTLTQGATGILNLDGTAGISSLNASSPGNTVNYTGFSQTVKPVAYHHLTLSGSGTPILTGVSTINGNFTLSGTVTCQAATGMTIAGNFSIGAPASFNAGTFSHALKGNWINSGTFSAGTSTLTLNGTSAQTMSGSTFNNLSIDNASGVTMLTDETVNGTLTLTSGTFSIGANTLNLNGLLSTLAGSLLGGTSSNIIAAGSGASTTLPGVTLNNFTLNRAGGIALGGDITINGTLTISNGTFTTGASTIIVGPTGTISEIAGQPVVGNITTTRNIVATSGTVSFGNIGADIALNGIAPGNTTVFRKTGTVSTGNGHTSILRYFDITPTLNTGLNAGLVFHYDDTELNGQDASAFELYRSHDNGSTWNNMGGTVNTISKTITIMGINDLSRWTASDTNDRIGNTASPTSTTISPVSKHAGDPGFTLTVNGTEFINDKSTVRFNGSDRTTTYISSTQLTASISASDLLIAGIYPVTVFNTGGGGLSNAQIFTVIPVVPVKVNVETAANGSGTIVSAQSLASGSSITVYAIARDELDNFVANVAATTWTLENITGGVVSGDLVPAVDGKSAVFTGHITGTTAIEATFEQLTATPSGTITVTPGAEAKVRVETAANGSGTIVPAQSLASGLSIMVYAITRDASDNFVANIAATSWTLENIAGVVAAGDLVPAVDSKSAVFTGHVTGSADIKATNGALSPIPSGIIIVTSGTATTVRVETAANGSGTVVPAQSLTSGSSITVFAITRDASDNFIANIAATSWTLENITGGVLAGDLVPAVDGRSATFTGHVIGTADIKATSGVLVTTPSGIITVIAGASAKVRAETAANGSGSVIPAQSLASGTSITMFAVARDASDNFVANVAATSWTLVNMTGGVVAGDLVPAVDGKSAVLTGHVIGTVTVKATYGVLATTPSGVITVTAGIATKVRVETSASGSGIVVPAQTLVPGQSITVYAIARDASNNFVANIVGSPWTLENITGGVVPGDLVAGVTGKSATFTGHVIGTANIKAISGVLVTTSSGTITVIAGAAAKIRVETAANGSGIVVPAQSLISGSSITVYAITRDPANNFVANVSATWTLQNLTNGVVAGDLVPAVDSKSAMFTGHATGTASIKAAFGVLPATLSGTITVIVPATRTLQGVTIGNGQSVCYDATQTIIVAGGGTSFVIQNGGSATMIAGQNIIYQPGTTVNPGGYMHGYITTSNQYCFPTVPQIPVVTTGKEDTPINPSNSIFRVYPNPTPGSFTLELKGDLNTEMVNVEIFGMRGDKILHTELPGNGKHLLSLSENKAGIYFIRVISGGRIETAKIIRQ